MSANKCNNKKKAIKKKERNVGQGLAILCMAEACGPCSIVQIDMHTYNTQAHGGVNFITGPVPVVAVNVLLRPIRP